MNKITARVQEMLADVAATLWLARHSAATRLDTLLDR